MSNNFCENTRKLYLASCLYDCIEDNNLSAIKRLLIENGANPNIILPDRGISPIHLAVGSSSEENVIEIIKLFLAHGGNPNVRSEEKLTPVHIAAAWGRLKILNILLKCGGDPSLVDDEGKTPLDYSIQEQHFDIIQFLESYMKDLTNNETTRYDQLYNLELDKIIIDNGAIVAEYGVSGEKNAGCVTYEPDNILNLLPKEIVNSYVFNWCMTHPQSNCDLENKYIELNETNKSFVPYISSDESFVKANIPRESGILTLRSSISSEDQNNITDLLNNCIITSNTSTNSSVYETCESLNSLEKNVCNSLITLDLSENDNDLNITSDRSQNNVITTNVTENIEHVTNIPCQLSLNNETNESIISISEEYKYVDTEENIVLIEKRILVNPKQNDEIISIPSTNSIKSSKVSSLPSVIEYDTDTLRFELTARGEPPGPITKTTKRVYLKKLKKLKKKNVIYNIGLKDTTKKAQRVYSVELQKTLRKPNWVDDLAMYKSLESIITNQFNNPDPNKRWREGITKASFTYLLLDPRITDNLPGRADTLSLEETWQIFLSAIFYVGKGKRSRPYSHLYQAVTYWKQNEDNDEIVTKTKNNKKVEYILDIWKEEFGVICLHIFQNVIPVEAYTREAAMINALKLENLCNSKLGDFYGISATWPEKQKRLLGVYLLYRAMLIFLNEGERQLRPDDIGK